MQCPACHNEVPSENAFCNQCGAPMSQAATPGAAPQAAAGVTTPPPATYAQPVAAGSGLSDTAAGAIAYLTIIPAIIFLVVEPYNKRPFVRFHSFQSIGLCVAWFAIWILVMIVHMVLHFIPLIGLLFVFVDLAIGVGFFLLWLFVILKASKGEWYKLPFIGDFAEKQARS
ncbi:MAG: DUF4870 domain-containing protein [Edaphobacter sp.]